MAELETALDHANAANLESEKNIKSTQHLELNPRNPGYILQLQTLPPYEQCLPAVLGHFFVYHP